MRFLLLISVVTWYVTCSDAIVNVERRSYKSADWQALDTVTHSVNVFAPNFYETLSKTVSGNVVCSPISAFMLLSMLSYGARGETREQIRNALALPRNNLAMGFQRIIDSFNDYPLVHLRLANKIYVYSGFELQTGFTDVTRIAFRAEAESLDFGDSQKAAKTINGWCESQTNNKIKDVVRPDDLNSHTALVLISAVYFKGNWVKEFDVTQTANSRFNVNSKTFKNIPTMFKNDKFAYGELPSVDARFVELPYEHWGFSDSISMFVILPNEIEGLNYLEKNLHKVSLVELLCGTTYEVSLSLPKFKIESEIPLEGTFQQMNVTDIFFPSADFSGIADYSSLIVSEIAQKAFIEVNEKGSEAAAISVMDLAPRMGGDDDSKIFYANHPFLVIISTKGEYPLPLFMARYTGPENMEYEN